MSLVRAIIIVGVWVGIAFVAIYILAGPASSVDFEQFIKSRSLRTAVTDFLLAFTAFLIGFAVHDVLGKRKQASANNSRLREGGFRKAGH